MPFARSIPLSRLAHGLLVAVVVLLGVGLRLNNLPSESVYWDEFSSLVHLRPPAGYTDSPDFSLWEKAVIRKETRSIAEFWQANRQLDPATMPLYYSFEYLVWNYGGQSVPVLRLLSVFFSLLAFPLFYLLGRALWGPAGGVTALFLFAVSPVHVQFAQEIRMYSLFGLLAIASAYTFYRVVEDGGRWWAPHLLVQVCLFWTHPFAVWLPFTEGLFLIFFFWRRWRFVLAWGFIHVALLIPSALYISTIQFFGEDTTSSWMVLPGWKALLGDIFADDYIGLTAQLWGRADFFLRHFSEETAYALANRREYYSIWCAVAVGMICLLGIVGQLLRAYLKRHAEPGNTRWKWVFFFIMWALLPPLILIALSHLWRPMIMPRYTMHCSFAFYLLAAGGIAALRWNVLRALPVALLLLVYGYQQGLVIDGPHRTNWGDVGRHIKEHATPEDLILSDNWLWKRVFTYNLGPVPQVLAYVNNVESTAEAARLWLDSAYPKDPKQPKPRGIWLVVNNGYFNVSPALELEAELVERGMTWEKIFFMGIEGIWLYRVLDDPMTPHASQAGWQPPESYAHDFEELSAAFREYGELANAICVAEEGLRVMPKHPRFYSFIGMNLKDMGEIRAATDALERAVEIQESDYPWTLCNLGECYARLGQPERAIPYLNKSLDVIQHDPHASWLLAESYLEIGQPWEAVRVLNEKLPLDLWHQRHWDTLATATQQWSTWRQAHGN
jgi:hypothetical protein